MINFKQEFKQEFGNRAMTYIGGGFGLVAGLAWNDAIKELIEFLFPLSKETLTVKFVYAVGLTTVVIIVIRYLEKIFSSGSSDKK